jgi:type IV pilus assembly protein PilN
MARINLLNWRDERRKQIEQQFYTMLAMAAGAGAAAIFAIQVQLSAMIDYQESRNNYLGAEIKNVEKAIIEIKVLEKEKADLLSRMNVIQELQGNRSDSVHMLDELVRVLPEGVHLTKFEQKKKSLIFDGIAQSNARVSAYMRNIESAEWLKNPVLQVIETQKQDDDTGYSQFILKSEQGNPNDKKQKDQQGGV